MSASHPKPEHQSDSGPQTLGDVLYARDSQSRVPESLWIDLVRSTAAADQIAFRELYGRTHHLVFTLIVRIVASRETAEELTLDVFHDVWRRAAGYDENGGTVLGWIMNQARSRAIDRLRFENRKKRVAAGALLDPDSVDDAETLVASHQRGRLLRQVIADLTPGERQAIETAFFSDCTYAEVAERLGEPPGTIKTRIRSGLAKLRAALARGGTYS